MERKKLEKFERPDLLKKIRWVSAEEGDGAGNDILSFEPDARGRRVMEREMISFLSSPTLESV